MGNTSRRKIEQLQICAEEEVEARENCFADVKLIHVALPEIDKEEIYLKTEFLGFSLNYPIMIASMTGGHPGTRRINEVLAEAAETLGVGMGVGSQRAALEGTEQEDSFRVVRDIAPNSFIYANLGAPQLKEYGIEGVERVIEMIDADAIAIHLNFLQEAIQPEGNVDARGCLALIKEVCEAIKKPVIVKETGAGISYEVVKKLHEVGVSAIDVGGFGGTSLAAAEIYRAKAEGDELGVHLGHLFGWDWGIPTVESIVECSALPFAMPIIATGGIRNGLDVAKSIALGADLCSAALPFLKPALESESTGERGNADRVIEKIKEMGEELKVAMFLTGCKTVEELKEAEVIITGKTKEIAEQRGFLERVKRKRRKGL
ncbi:type 2 isopentenyl-diphosphate Delta-isomerase [Methanophagales archaeon]|nr:MAG: type 2 isopentenyl-diphosphate Delta-isomerase [Methanophagales archaeon]RLG32285.1 MAG: type 2 isopentenyl-diphosphate Delta-isomerase [Methanosarcinales archaeon]